MTQKPSSQPFLNWAGGKRRLVHYLREYSPHDFATYWEPFLGAGALFFAVSPSPANLSDLNADLMACYEFVRDKPTLVARNLAQHKQKHSEQHYNAVRDAYTRSLPSAAQAARFIYLNKACFNGIYRVNKKGKFNVPFGFKKFPTFPSLASLQNAATILNRATLRTGSFDAVLTQQQPSPGDFVYLDPPYPPLNHTSNFRHYTPGRFSLADHRRLAEVAHELSTRGCSVLISNADIEEIRCLYRSWTAVSLPVTRWIAANGSRHKVNELLLMNYTAGKPE